MPRLAFSSVVVKTSVDVNMVCGVRTSVVVLSGVVVSTQQLWCQDKLCGVRKALRCQDQHRGVRTGVCCIVKRCGVRTLIPRRNTIDRLGFYEAQGAFLVLVRSIDSFCFTVT